MSRHVPWWAVGLAAVALASGGMVVYHARNKDKAAPQPLEDRADPIWAYPDLYQRIDEVLLPGIKHSKDFELRHELYTQMMVSLDENRDGHWHLGSQNCEDAVAYEFHVRKGEGWSGGPMTAESLAQAKEDIEFEPDSGTFSSLMLGGLWRYPPQAMVTLRNPRVRFVEGEEPGQSGLLGSIECETVGDVWCANPIFEILATDKEGARISLPQSLDMNSLPSGRLQVRVPVPDFINLEEEAEFWITAFVARPKAGIFRVSNVLVLERSTGNQVAFMDYKHKDIYDLLERKIEATKIRRLVYSELAWARETGKTAHLVVGAPYVGGGNVVYAHCADGELVVKQLTAGEAKDLELPGDGQGIARQNSGYRPLEKELGLRIDRMNLSLSKGDEPDHRLLEGRILVKDHNDEAIWSTDAQVVARYTNTEETGAQVSGELYDMLPNGVLHAGWNDVSFPLPATADLAKGVGISITAFVGMPEAGLFQVTQELMWTPDGEAPAGE